MNKKEATIIFCILELVALSLILLVICGNVESVLSIWIAIIVIFLLGTLFNVAKLSHYIDKDKTTNHWYEQYL